MTIYWRERAVSDGDGEATQEAGVQAFYLMVSKSTTIDDDDFGQASNHLLHGVKNRVRPS